MALKFHASTLVQGTGGDQFLVFSVTNLEDLPDGNIFTSTGLQTPGWFLTFDLKSRSKTNPQAIVKSSIMDGGIAILSPVEARISLLPDETAELQRGEFCYSLKMQNALTDPTEVFLLEDGYINVAESLY